MKKPNLADIKYPLFFLMISYVILHTLLALSACHYDGQELFSRLTYLDSSWYLTIAERGYDSFPDGPLREFSNGAQYAFLPLWPLVLRGLTVFSDDTYLAVLGTLLSLALFSFVMAQATAYNKTISQNTLPNILYPTSVVSLALLFFNPGGWVFFSNHTESLFLCLSFFALHFAGQKKIGIATLLAGLATLTRNQGILVAITVGLFTLEDRGESVKHRALTFLKVGLGSACFYLSWLVFLYLKTGDIFASSRAQQNWRITRSWQEYLSNATWLSPNNAARAALFWAVVGSGLWLLTQGRGKYSHAKPLGFYLLSSALLWPLQGNNFPQAYRFGAVLFPFWNILGRLATLVLTRIKPRYGIPLAIVLLALLITVAGTVSSYFYFQIPNKWPY